MFSSETTDKCAELTYECVSVGTSLWGIRHWDTLHLAEKQMRFNELFPAPAFLSSVPQGAPSPRHRKGLFLALMSDSYMCADKRAQALQASSGH